MTTKQYAREIEMRGGKRAVAKALGLSVCSLNRRLLGQHRLTNESVLAIRALPVRKDWSELFKIKTDRTYRNHYRLWALAMPHGEERERRLKLLAEAATVLPGRKVALDSGDGDAPCKR